MSFDNLIGVNADYFYTTCTQNLSCLESGLAYSWFMGNYAVQEYSKIPFKNRLTGFL